MRNRSIWIAGACLAVVAAACATTTETSTTSAPAQASTQAEQAPPRGPSALEADAQTGDGTAITVAMVTLPAPGFIAVHANADGGPGPVIGHSALLPAGTSTDVVITLDQPLTASDLVFPMVHIDMNGNGEYEFAPPDVKTDVPGLLDDGETIAVIGVEFTLES